ncbi:MAG: gfo/Idh/MocA family oxidoreductase, partial [Proteobacteria bacterium]|nr:gfo/Idh/MocA family oxidoreductase [Pseudomonadota bacterium]
MHDCHSQRARRQRLSARHRDGGRAGAANGGLTCRRPVPTTGSPAKSLSVASSTTHAHVSRRLRQSSPSHTSSTSSRRQSGRRRPGEPRGSTNADVPAGPHPDTDPPQCGLRRAPHHALRRGERRMNTHRAAIIGLTWIAAGPLHDPPHPVFGHIHADNHAAGYLPIENVTVVGACDLVPERNAEFIANWGTHWPEARTYTNYKQMLTETSPSILSVVTPDHRHADIVVAACEAGVRGIYCEKPIATTLADADRIIAACRAHDVVLSIDHTRRWRQVWHQARNLVRSGDLGPLRRIVATLAGPRAMLFRNATHLV